MVVFFRRNGFALAIERAGKRVPICHLHQDCFVGGLSCHAETDPQAKLARKTADKRVSFCYLHPDLPYYPVEVFWVDPLRLTGC